MPFNKILAEECDPCLLIGNFPLYFHYFIYTQFSYTYNLEQYTLFKIIIIIILLLQIENRVNYGRGPYNFTIRGQNYHKKGSLVPDEGNTTKFQQLYIIDTKNEVSNQKQALW